MSGAVLLLLRNEMLTSSRPDCLFSLLFRFTVIVVPIFAAPDYDSMIRFRYYEKLSDFALQGLLASCEELAGSDVNVFFDDIKTSNQATDQSGVAFVSVLPF